MARHFNKREVAEILSVSERTLSDWQAEGMPFVERGVRGEENAYDLRAIMEWHTERAVRKIAPETQRDRLARLQADLLELDLAEKTRNLVPVAEVKPLWDSYVLTAAAFMLGRHSRLAAMLEAAPGIQAKRALLKTEDANFLTKLGGDGERMQGEIEALLATLPAEEASAFLRRVAGDNNKESAGPRTPDRSASY